MELWGTEHWLPSPIAGFRSVPGRSILVSIVSPTRSGVSDSGAPVATMSPGSSVMIRESIEMAESIAVLSGKAGPHKRHFVCAGGSGAAHDRRRD
jgi:hypothetical protein